MKISGSILKRYGPIYIAVSAILAICISIFVYTKEKSELLTATEATNQRIFKSLTLSLENPLRLSNLRSISEIVGIYRSIGVEYIKILDADEITIFEMGMVENNKISHDLKKIVHLQEDIGAVGYKIGSVEIISSLENLHDQLDKLVKNIAVFGTMIFLLMSVASLIVFNRLAKKIKTLDDWVKEIKNLKDTNELPANESAYTDDEIGRLYLSFKKLIQDLRASEEREIEALRLSSIGQAARLLAHDIRRPFSQVKSILASFDMIQENPSLLAKARSDVNKSIEHVESMINDIMDYSREEIVQTRPASLIPVLDFSIRQVASSFRDAEISFSYQFHHSVCPFLDEERMARAISNIIGNSIEAITIIGGKKFGKIHFITKDVMKNGVNFVELTIGNDGPAIAPEDFPKLFESLFTKGKKRGTGLGLASVKKIIHLHQGEVFAHNISEYWGVEFKVLIPSSTVADKIGEHSCPSGVQDIFKNMESSSIRNEDELEVQIRNLHKSDYKILLLEDEILYKAAVRNILRCNDKLHSLVDLFEASNVNDAIKLVEQENIEYVIADIDLGEARNGFDFLKVLKQRFPHVKSIVHSNRCVSEDKIMAKELGAVAFVPKPLELRNIIDLISENVPMVLPAKKIVFFADDDELTRKLAEKYIIKMNSLEQTTHEICTFGSAEELLSNIQSGRPVDVVLTDHNMGGMSGLDLIKQLRELKFDKKIYMVANYSVAEFEALAVSAGADGFFQAPIDAKILKIVLSK